jgi:uncharacterized protein (DUF1697 family)
LLSCATDEETTMARKGEVYVALLRAVNVGGTGKLPMSELVAMCTACGFSDVRTYIASGNVVFTTTLAREAARKALETRLAAYAGKPVGVVLRTAAELADVLRANPFPGAAPNRTVVIFLDEPVAADCLATLRHCHGEQVVPLGREIHVHYGDGMASSKLVIPAAKAGTGRNLNTVAKLQQMAGG